MNQTETKYTENRDKIQLAVVISSSFWHSGLLYLFNVFNKCTHYIDRVVQWSFENRILFEFKAKFIPICGMTQNLREAKFDHNI